MSALPTGTVTFLFTDIEGSTIRWERDPATMAAAVNRPLALLARVIAENGGVHFKTVGDAMQAAFPTARQALTAAIDGQRALQALDWRAVGGLPVRMALHAGEAAPDERGDYLAAPLNRLSRLLSTGHGGQVLVSQAVQQLVRDILPPDASLYDLGEHRLRDLLAPERVFQVRHPDLPDRFPGLRSLDARHHNLPRQPTPFFGREREVRDIVDLMRSGSVQLLTLTSPGGTGKTRLAIQAADSSTERAARLLGAAAATQAAAPFPLLRAERSRLDRVEAAVRQRLREEDFAGARAVGEALSAEDALDEALHLAVDTVT